MNKLDIRALSITGIVCLLPAVLFADGIDLVAYLSRTPFENIWKAIPAAMLLMVVNYFWNLLVIGLSVHRLGLIPFRSIYKPLIWITLLGQIADRIGVVVSAISAEFVANLVGLHVEGGWLIPLLVLNFLFSGISIGVLVFWFSRRRWKLRLRHSFGVAILAAILTNPAWAIGLLFLPHVIR